MLRVCPVVLLIRTATRIVRANPKSHTLANTFGPPSHARNPNPRTQTTFSRAAAAGPSPFPLLDLTNLSPLLLFFNLAGGRLAANSAGAALLSADLWWLVLMQGEGT